MKITYRAMIDLHDTMAIDHRNVAAQQFNIRGIRLKRGYHAIGAHQFGRQHAVPAYIGPQIQHPITGLAKAPKYRSFERLPNTIPGQIARNALITNSVNCKVKRR
ncbi:hypothetical protein N878_04710 [Pseudomonas sp. EGD-AK9]|nr:hypothetical protein N878_04710 [Pseudomonas sp. EGD-AK9]